jgi:acylglycerol lipase
LDHASIRRIESRFRGGDGRSLMCRAWLPVEPERVLLVTHGFAEHSGRYESLGSWFAHRGCAVHAYDLQGHGLSAGRRGHVKRFEDFLDDLGFFLEEVRLEHPELPCFLVGHSMGGLIVAAFAQKRAPEVAGVVTSGAALALSPELSGAKAQLARILGRILPRFSMEAGLDAQGLSRDSAVVRRYLEDPLVGTRITMRLAAEMMRAVVRTQAGGADVTLPMLVLHGGDDPLCLATGSERFFASLPRQRVPGSALRVYPELRHEIFNEPEREKVFADVLEWVQGREAEARRGAAQDRSRGPE